jgi:hypothetical protein
MRAIFPRRRMAGLAHAPAQALFCGRIDFTKLRR